MRKNVFLHFLNRDSREIFGLYRWHAEESHVKLLKAALNVSVLLCEEHCVIPPGFAIEDEIAFGLSEVNQAFFSSRLFILPMREANLGEYAEKKRLEYFPQRDRYSGLFNDRRLEFLGQHATGIVPRRSRIGEEIVSGWQAAPDSKGKLWTATKSLLTPAAIEQIRTVPTVVANDGLAVTWAEISQRLPLEARRTHSELRNSLQHIYFRQYCQEFRLSIICELPFARDDFSLPSERGVYSYHRFASFLDAFSLRDLLLYCSAGTLCAIKQKSGLIEFLDAYQGVARLATSLPDLQLRAQHARKASRFSWDAFAVRHRAPVPELDDFAIAELDDALSEAANLLAAQNGTPKRLDRQATHSRKKEQPTRRTEVTALPEVLLYVALEEELEVLQKHFNLQRHARNPVASGKIGGVQIGVISAYAMGRVPAAVAVARYLEPRKSSRPKLILIVGLAGGFEAAGTQEGHIICATTAADLASRKVQDDDEEVKTRFRRKDHSFDSSLAAVLRSNDFDEQAWINAASEAGDWPKDRRPSLHYGALASVDEVVASEPWAKKLMESTEKLLGVEMEAGGVCEAASLYSVPVAMLRAVSDKADPVKADNYWRKRGMVTIAVLLKHVRFADVFNAMEP